MSEDFLERFEIALENFLLTEIGAGITFGVVWLVSDLLFYIVTFFVLFKVVKPLVNAICEKIKNKK